MHEYALRNLTALPQEFETAATAAAAIAGDQNNWPVSHHRRSPT